MVRVRVVRERRPYFHKATYVIEKYFIQLRKRVAQRYLGEELDVRELGPFLIVGPKRLMGDRVFEKLLLGPQEKSPGQPHKTPSSEKLFGS